MRNANAVRAQPLASSIRGGDRDARRSSQPGSGAHGHGVATFAKLPTNVLSGASLLRNVQRPSQAAAPPVMDRLCSFSGRQGGPGGFETQGHQGQRAVEAVDATVQISSSDIVERRAFALDGMTAEIVQATRCKRVEYRFRASRHLLVVCEHGERSHGDTFVEGLPQSSLRDFKKKLTFVPAGREYREWQELRDHSRIVYFYFDPARMPIQSNPGFANFAPRLYFEDAVIWETALKLTTVVENPGANNWLYLEALAVVLAHELVRLNSRTPMRGGLAGWQKRAVTGYIEEHLAEEVLLAGLAQLVRLSPHYFCRAFKQSFGMPPHQYHTNRRIERAKALLAKPAPSVTDIGLMVGFSETSSFSTAFRKATGFTPTAYHRSLE